MTHIIGSRCVLAVCDLEKSIEFYTKILGFQRDPIDAEGWSFLSRDGFRLMLGECPEERPASELGNHSYFVYIELQGVDDFHEEIRDRGVDVISEPENKPWGMREFGIRTVDGHRIMFGEEMRHEGRSKIGYV